MIYLLDNTDSSVVYILIVLLILIVIAIFYLVYNQHKEMVKILAKDNNVKKEIENRKIERKSDNGDNLIKKTDSDIPDKFQYTQALWQKDDIDLEELSKELDGKGAIRTSITDQFEAEQEEQAIISYDELINKHQEKKVSIIKDEMTVDEKTSYEHEERFLDELKKLNKDLR